MTLNGVITVIWLKSPNSIAFKRPTCKLTDIFFTILHERFLIKAFTSEDLNFFATIISISYASRGRLHLLSHVAVDFLSLDCVLIQRSTFFVVVLFRILASNDSVIDDYN